jgi:hypothetical protein
MAATHQHSSTAAFMSHLHLMFAETSAYYQMASRHLPYLESTFNAPDGSYASALVLECGERSLQDMLERQRPTDLPRKVCYVTCYFCYICSVCCNTSCNCRVLVGICVGVWGAQLTRFAGPPAAARPAPQGVLYHISVTCL